MTTNESVSRHLEIPKDLTLLSKFVIFNAGNHINKHITSGQIISAGFSEEQIPQLLADGYIEHAKGSSAYKVTDKLLEIIQNEHKELEEIRNQKSTQTREGCGYEVPKSAGKELG